MHYLLEGHVRQDKIGHVIILNILGSFLWNKVPKSFEGNSMGMNAVIGKNNE